jgi:hypothetical protein
LDSPPLGSCARPCQCTGENAAATRFVVSLFFFAVLFAILFADNYETACLACLPRWGGVAGPCSELGREAAVRRDQPGAKALQVRDLGRLPVPKDPGAVYALAGTREYCVAAMQTPKDVLLAVMHQPTGLKVYLRGLSALPAGVAARQTPEGALLVAARLPEGRVLTWTVTRLADNSAISASSGATYNLPTVTHLLWLFVSSVWWIGPGVAAIGHAWFPNLLGAPAAPSPCFLRLECRWQPCRGLRQIFAGYQPGIAQHDYCSCRCGRQPNCGRVLPPSGKQPALRDGASVRPCHVR